MFRFLSLFRKTDEESSKLQPPDLERVIGYREKIVEKDPGVTIYRNAVGSIELRFINAKHQHTGTINGNDDPTLETIRIVIDDDENKPDFVIGEGHNTQMTEVTREGLLSSNRKLAESGGDIPESGYAMYLADREHILYIGGEISGSEFFEQMQTHGYTTEDVIAANFMQKLSEENIDTTNETEFATQHAERIMQLVRDKLDPQHKLQLDNFTFDKFKEWYTKKQPLSEGKSFLSISRDDFVPDVDGNWFKKYMVDSGEVRDRYIPRLLYQYLNEPPKKGSKTRRGVIVYGASHLPSMDPVIQQMFGDRPGEYMQLVKSGRDAQVPIEQMNTA